METKVTQETVARPTATGLPFEWTSLKSGVRKTCTFIAFVPEKGWFVGDNYYSEGPFFADRAALCAYLENVLSRLCSSCGKELREVETSGVCLDCQGVKGDV